MTADRARLGSSAYYASAGLLPTGETASSRRAGIFAELGVGVSGRSVVELGPDRGGNSEVFLGWGAAELVLVEPHELAIEVLRSRFTGRAEIVQDSLESYAPGRRFDVVDAEGFVYALPLELWPARLAGLTAPGGVAVVSVYDRPGGLVELLTKALFRRFRELAGVPSVVAAERLFRAKWDRVEHVRSFEAWVGDVLENPFVDARYFLSVEEVTSALIGAGFGSVTSVWAWPPASRSVSDTVEADVVSLLTKGAAEIERYCNEDEGWLSCWGSPCRFYAAWGL